MAARDSRDKKGVERFVPPEEQQEKGKHGIFEVNPEVLKKSLATSVLGGYTTRSKIRKGS